MHIRYIVGQIYSIILSIDTANNKFISIISARPSPFALSTLMYPFVLVPFCMVKTVLNGYLSTRVSLWDSLMFFELRQSLL